MAGETTVTPGTTLASGNKLTLDDLNLLGNPVVVVNAGAITARELADGEITSDKLATDLSAQLGVPNNSVTTSKLVDGAVTEPKLGTGAVTEAKLGTGAVTEAKLGTGAVTEGKLVDGAVTEAKLGTGAVTIEKLSAGARNPIGTILDYAGSTAPTGYLLCYGQQVSRTTYADLFTVLGTTYGVGDGSTTFNLPDLRGRVGVGKDDMGGSGADRMTTGGSGLDGVTLGATGGDETVDLAPSNIPSNFINEADVGDTAKGIGSDLGAGHNNVQPSIILNKIIFTGVL